MLRIIIDPTGLIVYHIELDLIDCLVVHALPILLDPVSVYTPLPRRVYHPTIDILDATVLLTDALVWALLVVVEDLLANDVGVC